MSIWNFFNLTAPDGPNNPWGNTTLIILDTLRVIICILGFLILGTTPSLVKRATVLGQKSRLIGVALFAITAILTEFNHIGDYGNWHFAVNLVGTVLTAWGYWSFLFWESGPTYSVNRREDKDAPS